MKIFIECDILTGDCVAGHNALESVGNHDFGILNPCHMQTMCHKPIYHTVLETKGIYVHVLCSRGKQLVS